MVMQHVWRDRFRPRRLFGGGCFCQDSFGCKETKPVRAGSSQKGREREFIEESHRTHMKGEGQLAGVAGAGAQDRV